MTISRGQMKRQLYEGGGIMGLSKEGIGGGDYRGIDMGSRAGFGIIKKITRGAKKAVKGATKAVKKIAKSPIGKAALLYGTTAGLGSLAAGKGFGSLMQLGTYAPSNVFANLGTAATRFMGGKLDPLDALGGEMTTGRQNIFQKALGAVTGGGKMGGIGKLATLGLVSKYLTDTLGMPPEQAEAELARDPSGYLRQYYTNLNPNAPEEEIAAFVAANTSEYAVGGRVGFANGPVLPPDPTQPVNPFGPKPGDFGIEEDIPIKMASNLENEKILEALFEKYIDMGLSPKDAAEAAQEEFERMSMMKTERRGLVALGGRMGFDKGTPKEGIVNMIEENMQIPMEEGERTPSILSDKIFKIFDDDMVVIIRVDEDGNRKLIPVPRSQVMPDMQAPRSMKAKGDSASMNAMQAAGVEGLPVRQNPKGVRELDLRETGGFIPPVGIKEKADDIPAMLSNNEFVMTADAVRGMGGGDVNLGAQRMYDQMKMLEAGGKV